MNPDGEKVRPLTPEEERAIKAIQRLAAQWPDTLWLFSASSTLCVMQKDAAGEQAMLPSEGVDPDYCVTTVDIENGGGDW